MILPRSDKLRYSGKFSLVSPPKRICSRCKQKWVEGKDESQYLKKMSCKHSMPSQTKSERSATPIRIDLLVACSIRAQVATIMNPTAKAFVHFDDRYQEHDSSQDCEGNDDLGHRFTECRVHGRRVVIPCNGDVIAPKPGL